jgi:hypothetical protein
MGGRQLADAARTARRPGNLPWHELAKDREL